MLSVENLPPDPSCPCEISQLKGSDERASDTLPLPEVDLFNSGLDDDTQHLPKFSIRDYVFGARSKDIKKNWPFSQRNLQLCLKHGVKDVLPPFQSLDSVREESFKRCAAGTCPPDRENICNSYSNSFRNLDGGEPSGSVPSSSDSAQPNPSIAAKCIDTNLSGSGGEGDFPSSTTTNSQSDIGSVHTHRLSSLALETDTLLEASADLEAAGDLAPLKSENKTLPSAKKCRLIVKLRSVSDPSSTEDIASNCTTLSEAMASKTCPVCKTFSSSSNTTLNAHIDQCLSVESTSRWVEDTKQTRHRIKPRKTRLMVDICATAPRCTLEELDRRNGSTWATDLTLPAQNTEVCADDEEGQRLSPVHLGENGDEGAVYIDASGTKVRILSKLNVPSSVLKVGEDARTRKLLKVVKGSKFFSTNKRKRHVNKYYNHLRVATQSKKDFSTKVHYTEIRGTREENSAAEDHEEERIQAYNFKAPEPIKPSDSGTLRQWVCSKRTGLSKKVNGKGIHQPPSYKLRTTLDLAFESDQSCLGDSYMEKNIRRFPKLLENLVSSESNKKRENSLNGTQGYDDGEKSPRRKRLGSSLCGARNNDNAERFREPLKQNANQSSKEITSVFNRFMLKQTSSIGNHVFPLSNRTSDNLEGPVRSPDSSTSAKPKPYQSKSLPSKSMKLSTSRKDFLSVHRSFLNKKCSTLKKPWMHAEAEISEESPSEGDDKVHDHNENQSGVEEINDGASQREDIVVLKRSQVSWSHGHGVGEHIDSSVRVSDDMAHNCDVPEMHASHMVTGSSEMCAHRNITTFNKPLGPKFNRVANPPENRSSSLQPTEEYKGPLCGDEVSHHITDTSMGDDQDMFCLDEVGNGIIVRNSFLGANMEAKNGQGNSFSEVDPIPIPGPPGSFLPSPRDMGSEDFQGNSSLTSSRIQSFSQDQHDLVDGDSSDSPISATSTISNSTVARPDLKCSEQLSSIRSQTVPERIRSEFSGTSTQPVLEIDGIAPERVSIGAERIILEGENLKVKVTSSIKGPLSFQDDDHPCCCSRKERTSQTVALNYQESQLLRRRTMASAMLPAIGTQTGCNMNTKPNNLNVSPERISISNNCSSSGSEKVVFPVMKAATDSIPINSSTDAAVKIPSHSDCDSASPSASNPILRLMGKNLMVVNKDDDMRVPLGETRPVQLNNCPNPHFLNFAGVSHSNAQNPDPRYFHHVIPEGSYRYMQDPLNTGGQCSGIRLVNSCESGCNPTTHALGGMFPNKRRGGAFAPSLGPHEYKGECNLVTQQNRSTIRQLGAASIYHMEKKATKPPDLQYRNSFSTGNSIKEIIIIDDTPEAEAEADYTTDDAKYSKCWRETQVPSADRFISRPPSYSRRHLNTLLAYQAQDPSPLDESPMVHGNSFVVPPSGRTNTSPVKWGCTSESSGVMQRNAFMPSSSSIGHLRSDLYYSPSLS